MSEPTIDELVRAGGAALRAGERERARQLLAQAVRANPRSEQAWLLLAGAVSDPAQRRSCLERVLRLNPEHAIARKALGSLPTPDAGPAAPASPQPAAQHERPQAAQPDPRPEPALTRQLAPKTEPERPAAPVSTPAHVAPAQATAPRPGSFEAILGQLRTPAAVEETTVAPPGLAAIAPPPAAIGTETTRLAPAPPPQFTLPMELAGTDARRRREARQLWTAVLIAGIVLLLIGLVLAGAVLVGR